MSNEANIDGTEEEPGAVHFSSSNSEIDQDTGDGSDTSVVSSSVAIRLESMKSDKKAEGRGGLYTPDSETDMRNGEMVNHTSQIKTPTEAVETRNTDLLKEIIASENYQNLKTVIKSDRFCELKEQFQPFDVLKKDGPYRLDFDSESDKDEENDREERESEKEITYKDEKEFKKLQASIENEQMALNKAMLAAISTNQTEALQLLLHAGADINAFDKWYPAIHTIVEMGSVDMFQIAKEFVRDTTVEGHYGNLLHAAVRAGSLEMLQMVYDSGISQFFGSTADGSSPLHVAVRNIPLASAETDQGESRDMVVTVENDEKYAEKGSGEKKLGHMTSNIVANDVALVADIPNAESDGLNKQSEESSRRIPLIKTPRRDLRIINFLLSKGFLVDYVDNKMKTALHDAAILGYSDVVQVLLNAGADSRLLDGDRNTPWLYAALLDHKDLYDMLIDLEDINKPFGNGLYYVHLACQNGNHKALSYILYNGGDVTIADRLQREKAIMVALQKRHMECLRILLKQPDPKSKTASYDWNKMYTSAFLSALDYFDNFRADNEDILELFLQKGANINEVIDEAQLDFNLEPLPMLEWVLNHGADPNYVNSNKGYPLLTATNLGYYDVTNLGCHDGGDVIKLLLKYNADVTMTDRVSNLWTGKKGLTPLQTAIDTHSFKLTRLCLAAGFSSFKVHNWLVQWLLKREHRDPYFEDYKDPKFEQLLEHIKDAEHSPMSLMALSRLKTLKCMGAGNTKQKIQQLEIPLILKEYLDWDKYLLMRVNELDAVIANQQQRKQENVQ